MRELMAGSRILVGLGGVANGWIVRIWAAGRCLVITARSVIMVESLRIGFGICECCGLNHGAGLALGLVLRDKSYRILGHRESGLGRCK